MITVAHEPTITATNIAREIFDCIHKGDYGPVISKLDQSNKKWTKTKLIQTITNIGCGEVGDWRKINKSANPTVEYDDNGFTFRHRIPAKNGWHKAEIILRFNKKVGAVHHIELDFKIL